MAHDSRNTSLPIENDYATSGEAVVLDTEMDHTIGVYIRGDAAADYDIDVSNKPASADSWFEAAETLTGATDYNYGAYEAARYVRVKVATGTGTGGDTADVLVVSAGDED